jgi:methylmalonyl-CoA mutase N-terminal domain/subunit
MFQIPVQELEASSSDAITRRMVEWKKTRDMDELGAAMAALYADAQKGDRFNLMEPIIEAVKAYGTSGEIMGVIRQARGLDYDPFNMIKCPFDLG